MDKEPLPVDQFGQFDSSKVYLIQYLYRKQSALYMWMEAMVYVWVGGEVGEEEEVRAALTHVETIGPTTHMVRLLLLFIEFSSAPYLAVYMCECKGVLQLQTSGEH